MTTVEFIKYANERPELCEKMSVCTAPEEVYAIATAEGLTDSLEEMKRVATEIKNSLELTDADLGNVSAAGDTVEWVSATVLSVVTSAAYTFLLATV